MGDDQMRILVVDTDPRYTRIIAVMLRSPIELTRLRQVFAIFGAAAAVRVRLR